MDLTFCRRSNSHAHSNTVDDRSFSQAMNLNLRTRTGQIAKSIHAGVPNAMSGVVFPGTARSIRVIDVKRLGSNVLITGDLGERATMLTGESPTFSMQIDRSIGRAEADFLGSRVVMRLDE